MLKGDLIEARPPVTAPREPQRGGL